MVAFYLLECNNMSSDSDSGDDWEENGEDHCDISCLFCTEIIKGFPSALHHIVTLHKFDLCDFIRKHVHDTYSYIKLINFVRRKEILPEQLSTLGIEIWDKDEYLRPVMEDDQWLMYGKYKEARRSFCRHCYCASSTDLRNYFNTDVEDLINIKDASEGGTKQICQGDSGMFLSEAQYEDMTRTIRSLKSQLKESETTCFLVKQV